MKYVVAIFTFGWGFAIIEEIFNNNYGIIMPINAFVNTVQGISWNHMWYLYVLVGIMLIMPVIKEIKDKNVNLLKYILLLLFIFSFVLPLLNNFLNIEIGFSLPLSSPYLFYVILGYFVDKVECNISKLKLIIINAISILILIFSNICVQIKSVEQVDFFGGYNSIVILVLSITIFLLIKNAKVSKQHKIFNIISQDSYGIYLLHMLSINFIYKFLNINIYGNWLLLKSIIVVFVSLITSIILTRVIKKIPYIKNLV